MTASGKLAADTKGNNIRFLENHAVTEKKTMWNKWCRKGHLTISISPRLKFGSPADQASNTNDFIVLYYKKNFIYQLRLGIKEIWRLYWQDTHTHPFNGPFSRTTRVSRYQKGKTNLDFTEARDCEWQWHQLGHMQVCISLQTDNHARTHHSVFYRPDALPAAQPTASKHWRQNSW